MIYIYIYELMMRFLSSILLKHCKHAMRNLDHLKYDMKILLVTKQTFMLLTVARNLAYPL